MKEQSPKNKPGIFKKNKSLKK